METNTVIKIGTIVISLLGAVITYILVPYIKRKTTAQQREDIGFWVYMAVAAAEQIFQIPKSGEAKKKYVIDYLLKLGIKLTDEELNILIEAAVYELNKAKDIFIEEMPEVMQE